MLILLLTICYGEGVPVFGIRKLNKFPHSEFDFTQGFSITQDRILIQSTGLYGESQLQKIEISTGRLIDFISLDEKYFGEGIEILFNKVYQLTWRERKIFSYELDSFNFLQEFDLPMPIKEGWGICTDQQQFYISDGSDTIYVLNQNFKIEDQLQVQFLGKSIPRLNELEWVNGKIWANVFYSNYIVIINPKNGNVESFIDLNQIQEQSDNADQHQGNVLNGIAAWNNQYFVTGKRWKSIYQITLEGPYYPPSISL